MGSKGKRQKGSFAHDYDNHVMWNTHVNLSDADLDAIAEAGNVTLSAEQRLDLKAEIETYASLAEAEKDAPSVGGSGRSSDFVDQHYVNLAKIYQSAGGVISLGRRNPSRKYPEGIAGSDFLFFVAAVNNFLPNEDRSDKSKKIYDPKVNVKKIFEQHPDRGLVRAIRRAIEMTPDQSIKFDRAPSITDCPVLPEPNKNPSHQNDPQHLQYLEERFGKKKT